MFTIKLNYYIRVVLKIELTTGWPVNKKKNTSRNPISFVKRERENIICKQNMISWVFKGEAVSLQMN